MYLKGPYLTLRDHDRTLRHESKDPQPTLSEAMEKAGGYLRRRMRLLRPLYHDDRNLKSPIGYTRVNRRLGAQENLQGNEARFKT